MRDPKVIPFYEKAAERFKLPSKEERDREMQEAMRNYEAYLVKRKAGTAVLLDLLKLPSSLIELDMLQDYAGQKLSIEEKAALHRWKMKEDGKVSVLKRMKEAGKSV